MSPRKNPKFSVAASTTKKPKTTFSRFTGPSRLPVAPRHSGPGPPGDVDDLAGDEPRALADQEGHRVRDVLRLPGAGDRDGGGALGHVLVPVAADADRRRAGHLRGDEARRDRVRRDAELAQLDGEG